MMRPAFFRAFSGGFKRTPRRAARFRAAVLALAACAGLMRQAAAEEVLHDPDAIRACLCRERLVATLARDLADDRNAYDAAEQQLKSATADADAARQKLDPNDAGAREAYGRLLDQRDAAQDHAAAAAAPLSDTVARYNAAVAALNSNCGGKAYDPAVLQQVRGSLDCPPEPLPPPRS